MRRAVIDRRTTETAIALKIELDGKGSYHVRTGIRFLDHMLELFARHGAFDLTVDTVSSWVAEAKKRGIEIVPISAVAVDPEKG